MFQSNQNINNIISVLFMWILRCNLLNNLVQMSDRKITHLALDVNMQSSRRMINMPSTLSLRSTLV